MKKQVLTIKDITTICVLLDREIKRRSYFDTSFVPKDEIEQRKKEFEEFLKHDVYYQNLLHLQESLEKIEIQVECPNIEIENKAKRKLTPAEQLHRIKELEIQLADKEKELLEWKDGTMICIYEDKLAEKDKEIEKLKDFHEFEKDLMCNGISVLMKEKEKEIRHQVCEEIRKTFEKVYDEVWGSQSKYNCRSDSIFSIISINDILDQIEKGE